MVNIGINGFGRIGRLAFRAATNTQNLTVTAINDPAGGADIHAHLVNFDSIQGRWQHEAVADKDHLIFDRHQARCTRNHSIDDTDWSGCDVVIEASGKMRQKELLDTYLSQGVKRVVVTAPVNDPAILNIVMGVNDTLYEPAKHQIVTAASCTTNCLAPVVKVIHEIIGIEHGSITTIHNITNTQSVLDQPHKDLRRARSCGSNLIPTTTGSAKAIALIFPELEGRLNGHAVRVPLANASLTDCVFETRRSTTAEEVNSLLTKAANNEMAGILGVEHRPLVSSDFCGDPRSSIVDALSTMVVNDTHLKLYAWYDNEWGYANRTVELTQLVAKSLA